MCCVFGGDECSHTFDLWEGRGVNCVGLDPVGVKVAKVANQDRLFSKDNAESVMRYFTPSTYSSRLIHAWATRKYLFGGKIARGLEAVTRQSRLLTEKRKIARVDRFCKNTI